MKVKWGVIGAGGIADRRTIPGIMQAKNAELVAVMEVNMELAEKIRSKYNAKTAYDNVDDLLADDEIDAVYIASPVIYHKSQAIKAAKAKKHILLEKPVAMTVEEGKEVSEICKKAGVYAASGFMMRFHVYHKEIKDFVEKGKLGSIVSCRAQLTCWYPDIPGNWRQQMNTSGGGALMDMGIHCIDLIQYITGSKAKKITALVGTMTFNYEVEDSASLVFETEKGAFCYVDSNFNIPDAAAKTRLEIYGTKGSILAEGTIGQVEGGNVIALLSDDSLEYDAKQDRKDFAPFQLQVEFGNMYAKEIESFSKTILECGEVDIPLEDALQLQTVVEAAYESSKNGRHIYI